MLPKAHKMKTEDHLNTRSEKGLFVYSDLFSLKVLENKDKTDIWSIIVSSKVAKRAVDRNKIRRRIYTIIEKNRKNLIKQDFIGVFIVKGPILKVSFVEIEQEVKKSLKKAGLL